MEKFKILSLKEELQLSQKELLIYYSKLREYLLMTPHESLTNGSLTVCKRINPIVRETLKKLCGYQIITLSSDNIKGLDGIYAHTHQSKCDHINLIATNPNHTIMINSSVLSNFYKLVLLINGVVYVDKRDKVSREKAKLELIRLLLQDKGITMFPESAWNLSPNKLHLPLYVGVTEIAKITGKPIIPVVQEYIYNDQKRDGIERVEEVYVEYGTPILVNETDNIFEKLEEYSTAIATMRWNLIEQKGKYMRNGISNYEYINFVEGCKRNLKNAGIDIEVETQGLFGANDEFYKFHHINALDYDTDGNFLEPLYVRTLKKKLK